MRKTVTDTNLIGAKGEEYAVDYLIKNGYIIRHRNYRVRFGEIDIVAENESYVVFVEVKTRHTNSAIRPYMAVDYYKQQKIIKAAKMYLAEYQIDKFCRLDVCEVYVDRQNLELRRINYIESAFEEESSYEAY